MRTKNKKKGFTLIELLGVLIILSAIVGLVFSSFSSALDNSSEKRKVEKIETLKSFSEIYVTDNRKEIYEWIDVIDQDNNKVNKCYISILRLKEKGYLPSNIYKEIKSGYIIYDKIDNTYEFATEKNGINSCVEDDRDEYLVTLNPNGGTVSPDEVRVIYGSTYGKLPDPVRYGHKSAGWYTEITGGTKITKNTKVNLTTDQTLFAHWNLGKYTVTFDPNGGTVSKTNKEVTYSKSYGDLPTPIREGYKFLGWYLNITGGEEITKDSIVELGEKHTLYANWEITSYTITFDPNGGTISSDSKVVDFGKEYGELETPKNGCHIFTGWYTEKDGGDLVSENTIVTKTEPHTLYAHWTSGTYMVVFDPNGGEVSPLDKEVTCGSSYGELPTPSYKGHTFTGWYTSKTGGTKITASSIVSITKKQTLYARWDVNKYIVTFDASGGTVYPSSKEVTYGETYGALPKPVRSDFVFIGWYTDPDEGTKIVSDTSVSITSAQVLYAHWTSESKSFSYTGTIQSWKIPVSGTYKLEVWGAQGGKSHSYEAGINLYGNGGKGGYSVGEIELTKGTELYVVVGGKGNDAENYDNSQKYGTHNDDTYPVYIVHGGYNGGGIGLIEKAHGFTGAGGGGGATHIGTFNDTLAAHNSTSGLYIVAGGGGGGAASSYNGRFVADGGDGGGENGSDGSDLFANVKSGAGYGLIGIGGKGATQTTGNAFGEGSSVPKMLWDWYSVTYTPSGGGGGGYYGGFSNSGLTFTTNGTVNGDTSANGGGGGGGGSGYIGGVINASMESGVQSGDGKAIITLIELSD